MFDPKNDPWCYAGDPARKYRVFVDLYPDEFETVKAFAAEHQCSLSHVIYLAVCSFFAGGADNGSSFE